MNEALSYKEKVLRFLMAVVSISVMGSTPVTAKDATYDLMMGVSGKAIKDVPDHMVSLSVTSADGSVDYGSCVLSIFTRPNCCSLDVAASTTIVAMVDESVLPTGIGVAENPITYEIPAVREGLGDLSFGFVYAGDDETPLPTEPVDEVPEGNDPVETLPETGTGTSARGDGASAMLAALAAASVLSAFAVRQVTNRAR